MKKHLLTVLCIGSLAALPACKPKNKKKAEKTTVKKAQAYHEELEAILTQQEEETTNDYVAQNEKASKEDIAKF